MFDIKTDKLLNDFSELEKKLSNPEIMKNMTEYQALVKEHSAMKDCVTKIKELRAVERDILNVDEILSGDDKDLTAYAKSEKEALTARANQLKEDIELYLNPGDKNDIRNVIMEIRAGTGGDEAALFAGDLFRMYTRFAERRGWKVEVISANQTGLKGFKEVIFNIQGTYVYKTLKYESGVHRVQRVPLTEASGRIHTSAITVAVLPEMDEIEVGIKNEDLRIDTFCSSGAGGQSVNTTYSAIRITHIPTGIVVQCQDERSQQRNKQKAMMVLRSKLMEKALEEQQSSIDADRKKQVGTGDRSEKIRTYNFPQDRLTDHRVGLNFHNLKGILDGEIDDLVKSLAVEMRKKNNE